MDNRRYFEDQKASYSVTERLENSIRILLDVEKGLEDKAEFKIKLSDKVDNVMALELEAVSFTGIDELAGGPGGIGIPYVPYFELEIVDNQSAVETRVGKVELGSSRSVDSCNLHGIPLVLNNSGYESITFETPASREYVRFTTPLGRLEWLTVKVRGPQNDPNYFNPKFERMVIVMRAILTGEPRRRPLRAHHPEVSGDSLAAAVDFAGSRTYFGEI